MVVNSHLSDAVIQWCFMSASTQYEIETGLPAYRKSGAFAGWPTPEYAAWLELRFASQVAVPQAVVRPEPQNYNYANGVAAGY